MHKSNITQKKKKKENYKEIQYKDKLNFIVKETKTKSWWQLCYLLL